MDYKDLIVGHRLFSVQEQVGSQSSVDGDRYSRALDLLRNCTVCEWRCGVNRLAGETGPCHLKDTSSVFGQYLSLTEEPEVVPALRVYLAGCNFRCSFCDTAPRCFEPTTGRAVDAKSTAAEWTDAIRAGAKTISVLGGEPTLHLHTLLEIAAAAPAKLPLVINTNLYMTPEVLELLEGIVTLYLADLKFGSDDCARQLAGVPHYVDVVRRNLEWLHGRTPVIVRHLLMPGHLECCFHPSVDWLAERIPGARFQLYTGFVPCWQADKAQLGRLNSRGEERAALEYLKSSNLNWRAGLAGNA